MYNHEPQNYRCPFCAISNGIEGDFPYSKQADIFYKDEDLIGIIASHGWETNRGHVVIFSKKHIENVYDINDDILSKIHIFSKKVTLALKEEYKCEGTTIRQNNEQPGDQDVWHFHLHVFPRYTGDNISQTPGLRRLNDPAERAIYAGRLRKYFN
jgi:histidine triad (HIT) family protein